MAARPGARPEHGGGKQREGPPRGAESLADLLARFVTKAPAGRALAREDLEARWREALAGVLEPALLADTRVLGHRDRVLAVLVRSSALLSELDTFHKAAILKSLRGRGAPFQDIADVTFKQGAFDTT